MPNNNSIRESKEKVEKFLAELKRILSSPNFDTARDLDILARKKGESPFDQFTTANTLLALNFNNDDIKNELLNLDVRDYAETIIDSKDASLPPFYVFYREIQSRDIYIKVKIRDGVTGKIFCVSFHFARFPAPNPLPYSS